jgi:hypothetical protein
MSAFVDGHLFVADWNDVRVFDMRDSALPRLVATETIATIDFSRVLALDAAPGGDAYLGEWTGLYAHRFHAGRRAPDVGVSAPSLSFPRTRPPEQSARTLIISNDGQAPLEIHGVEATSPFEPLGSTLSIGPGQRDFVEVRFRPSNENPFAGLLTLSSNDPDQCELEVQLFGNTRSLDVGDPIFDKTFTEIRTGEVFATRELEGSVLVLAYFATF